MFAHKMRPLGCIGMCGYMAYIGELYKLIGVGSALLVQTRWAMREASECGMSDMVRLPRFFCIATQALKPLNAEVGRSRRQKGL